MLRKIQSLAIAIALAVLAPAVSMAQEQQQAQNPLRQASSPGERIWVRQVPIIKKAESKYLQAANDSVGKIFSKIRAVKSEQGIEAFIEEAMSLKSKGMMVTDPDGHKKWLRSLFTKHVVPVAAIHAILAAETQACEAAFAQIDNDVLIQMKADVPLDPTAIRCQPLSTKAIDQAIDEVIDNAYDEVGIATVKGVIAFLSGTVAFDAGNQMTRDAIRNQKGSLSFFDEIFAFGVGVVADIVVNEVSNELMGTRSELRKQLNVIADKAINRCLDPKGDVIKSTVSEFGKTVQVHQDSIIYAVVDQLEVGTLWAVMYYIKN